jgi:saposin
MYQIPGGRSLGRSGWCGYGGPARPRPAADRPPSLPRPCIGTSGAHLHVIYRNQMPRVSGNGGSLCRSAPPTSPSTGLLTCSAQTFSAIIYSNHPILSGTAILPVVANGVSWNKIKISISPPPLTRHPPRGANHMIKAAAVLALLALAASPVAWAMPASLDPQAVLAPNRLRDTCETCMAVVGDAEDYMAKPTTQDAVVTFVQTNICSLLPSDSERTCSSEARVFVAQAVATMETSLPPDAVCSYMGACGAGAWAQAAARASGLEELQARGFPVECPICKLIMTNIMTRLKDPESRADIYKHALEACDQLASAEEISKCRTDIVALFSSLDSILADIDAGKACTVLQFCAKRGEESAPPAPPPPGVAALRQLPARLESLPPNASEESCDACKSVISEADAIIMNPDTQAQIKDFVKSGCDAFEDYKDTCVEYVETYAPMIFGMAVSYLQPGPFCARLGYCPDAPPSF